VSLAAIAGPSGEQVAQRTIDGFGLGLQRQMSAFLRRLHLLFLGKAFADDEVDGGLGEPGRDDLAVLPGV
jgi:hypothetical protein